jgi:hypothetical protein
MRAILTCVSACLLLGACATPDTVATDDHADREYRTGSNIAQRMRTGGPGQGVVTISAEELERMKAQNSATLIPNWK